jgi:hypothetical protein
VSTCVNTGAFGDLGPPVTPSDPSQDLRRPSSDPRGTPRDPPRNLHVPSRDSQTDRCTWGMLALHLEQHMSRYALLMYSVTNALTTSTGVAGAKLALRRFVADLLSAGLGEIHRVVGAAAIVLDLLGALFLVQACRAAFSF